MCSLSFEPECAAHAMQPLPQLCHHQRSVSLHPFIISTPISSFVFASLHPEVHSCGNMSVSSTRVPLSARPKDLAMFIYFVMHIPTTALMDVVPLYPAFLTPYIQPLIKFTGEFHQVAAGMDCCTPFHWHSQCVISLSCLSVTRPLCMNRNPNQQRVLC